MNYKYLVKTNEFKNLKKIIEDQNKNNKTEFNIFKILKLENQEIRHSAFLAYLLDPNQNHGFDEKFLEALIKKVDENVKINVEDKTKITVETEHTIKECSEEKAIGKRIDILITAPKCVCVIENKYGSNEHDEQCQMYKKYIQEKYQDNEIKKVFIYLDIVKHDIENFQDGNPLEGYISLSYRDILDIFQDNKNIIDKQNNEIQKDVINQYINILYERYNSFSDDIKDACNNIIKIDIDEILKLLTSKSPNDSYSVDDDDCQVIYKLQDYVWIEIARPANDITKSLSNQICEKYKLEIKEAYKDKQYAVYRCQKENQEKSTYLAVRNALNIIGEGNSIGTCIVEKSNNDWKEISRTRCILINRNDFFTKLINNNLEEDKLIDSFLTEYDKYIENDISHFF